MGQDAAETPLHVPIREIPPSVLAEFNRKQREEEERVAKFGAVRPIISTEFQDHRFVVVGDSIHWSKQWRSFHDFLLDYIKKVLGAKWGNGELAKPLHERHVILQWYQALCDLKAREKQQTEPDDQGRYESELDGPSKAYLLLAYDLFVLRDHQSLQEAVVNRLKHPDQFQGARFELFVAATMIRAGFDLEYEDEGDPSRKHPEFVATHRRTGHRVAVEAKSRHRPGVLGRDGLPPSVEGFKLGLRGLLRSALAKPTALPFMIFVDANMPPEVASPLSIVNWQEQVHEAVAAEEHPSSALLQYGLAVVLTCSSSPIHPTTMAMRTRRFRSTVTTPCEPPLRRFRWRTDRY